MTRKASKKNIGKIITKILFNIFKLIWNFSYSSWKKGDGERNVEQKQATKILSKPLTRERFTKRRNAFLTWPKSFQRLNKKNTHFNFYIVKQERREERVNLEREYWKKKKTHRNGILSKKRITFLFLFARIIKGWWGKM